jgi:acetoacetyl-CoA synthetase
VCGFSFGGLVAFEIARRLRAAGEDIGLLALLDTDFPECTATFGARLPARFAFFRHWIHPVLQRARRHLSSLRRLGPAGYVRTAVSKPASNADQDPVTAVQAANLRAALDYIHGTVTYFRAEDSASSEDRRDRWSRVAASIDVIPVKGGHSAVRLGDQAAVVARKISERL